MLIRETARRLAHLRWIETRLFECTGAWVADEEAPAVRRLLATESRHHGWRASMWDELVPVLHDLDPGDTAPTPAAVAFLDAVGDARGTVERLTGLANVVLPYVLRCYEDDLASATEVSDAPVARVLRLVSLDAGDDWRAAEALLRSSPGTEDEAARAAARQSDLERLLGLVG